MGSRKINVTLHSPNTKHRIGEHEIQDSGIDKSFSNKHISKTREALE
jgi:hypothetical protein